MRLIITILLSFVLVACQTTNDGVAEYECLPPSLSYVDMTTSINTQAPGSREMVYITGAAAQVFMNGFNATPPVSSIAAAEIRPWLLSNGNVFLLLMNHQISECVRSTFTVAPQAFGAMLEGRAFTVEQPQNGA